jgi:hypothetical protein
VKHALTMEMAGEQPVYGKSDIAHDSKEANFHMAVLQAAGDTEQPGTQEEESIKPTSSPIAQPLQFSNSSRVLEAEQDRSNGRMPDLQVKVKSVLGQIDDADWQAVAEVLDTVAPMWSSSIRSVQLVGNMIVVIVSISVDGVTREGIGAGSGELEVALRNAEDEALKRAANKFGIARLQAHSNSELVEQKIAAKHVGGSPCDPQARSMAELVMPRQLGIMRALARESGVDADKECMQALHCKTEELSKRAASSFIEYLRRLPFKKRESLRKAS